MRMMMKKLQVGIVGYGFSGEIFHAALLKALEEFELAKFVSSNPQKVKSHFPNAEVVSNIEDLLSDPNIDVVIVTTPNITHYPFAKQALLAGKHVVVEKPFVNHSKDADDLIRIAAQENKVLSVYQNRRWDNDFLTVKACIESGALGEVYYLQSNFDYYQPQVTNQWREQDLEGSGKLYDLGAHLIDQALLLFGLPDTISGDVLAQKENGVADDYFHIILGYGKLRVILHSGTIVKHSGPRFQVHGSKGSFIKYGLDPQADALIQGKRPGDPIWGKEHEEYYGELSIDIGGIPLKGKIETIPGSYESFYKELYLSITEKRPAPVSATDAMNTIKVIEAVKKSNQEKRVVHFLYQQESSES
jgi:scyllo-inositol 2-dehydrogenase (NADP+)